MNAGLFRLSPEEWTALRALLDEGLALPPAERTRWLDTLDPARHGALKPRLVQLLAHAGNDGGTAQRLLDTLPGVETASFAPAPPPPEGVGPYRLLRLLGEGGMGSVWLAERTDMLQRRQVALKLPHGAWKRAGLAERLAREREILATLEHPHVARLYDAGVAADGQPWLALEHVDGERIDAYARRHALDVPQRVRLFLQVAQAVAHAHACLVLHRDLKPSNILVTGAGEVKLLDFGIAKLMQEGVAGATELTHEGGRVMTPDYASPEQVLGQPLSTASDVYSLGVVLFELLAGERPYSLVRPTPAALEQAIVEGALPLPSAVAPKERRATLRGNLDTIVLKALKRDPAQRYATVAALAEDLQRHLDHRPVLARPDSLRYRTLQFVRRHKWPLAATSAVMLGIVGGGIAAAWQARVAIAERERADQVKTFIADLLRDANPAFQGGRKVTVDQLLLATPPKIDSKFSQRPEIRAELLAIVGTSLSAIGEEKAALPLLEAAARDADRSLGPEHALTLQVRSMVISQRRLTQPGPEVATEADRLLAAMRRNPAVDPAYMVNLLGQRAQIAAQAGQHDQAVKLADEAHRMATQRVGEAAEQTLNTAVLLAYSHQRNGDWRQALEAARRVQRLVFEVRKLPDDHFNAVEARLMLGMALADAGQLAEGLEQLEAGVRHALVRREPMDSTIGNFRLLLARVQARAGRLDAATENVKLALQIQRSAMGPKSRRYAAAADELGQLHLARREPERAIEALSEAQAYLSGSADALAPVVASSLASALMAVGRRDEAHQTMERVSARAWQVLYRHGQMERHAGRFDPSRAKLDEALAALPDAPGQRVARAEILIERGLSELGLGQAAPAATSFAQAIDLLRGAQLEPTPALAEALVGAGRALAALQRAPEARRHLAEGAALWQRLAPTHPSTLDAQRSLQSLGRS